MSTQDVLNEIKHFINSEENLAMCLSGPWGVGKTYTWDTVLTAAFRENEAVPKKYSYVSLFGIESLSDVRRTLFENTVEAAAFKETVKLQPNAESIRKRLSNYAAQWRNATSLLRGIPMVADYGGLADKIGFMNVRNQIICIDDLERRSESLALKDILGLISLLKEKKSCKVVLILNSEALSKEDKDAFNLQLEKVIDVNLTFDPTPEEASKIALPNQSQGPYQLVSKHSETLGIANVRTIFKLRRIAQRLAVALEGYDKRILEQSIHSACLYGFSIYQPDVAPPLSVVLDQRPYAYLFGEKEKTPEQIKWSEFLTRYKYNCADDFDLAVYESVKSGLYDAPQLKKAADKHAEKLRLEDQDRSFNTVWDTYHNSFDDDAASFAENLKKSLVQNAKVITPGNLSVSIKVLKELGYNDGLNEIIQGYISARDENKDFWLGTPYPSGNNVQDPDVALAFKNKANEFTDERRLVDVVTEISRNRAWDRESLAFVNSFSADQYYANLKSARGHELQQLTHGLLFFRNISNADAEMKEITQKAISALRRIAGESTLNRARVEKYGITLKDEEDAPLDTE